MINKFVLLALTGCVAVVTAYAVRRQSRGEEKRFEEELQTWEGEGGLPAPAPPRPAAVP